MATQPNTIIRIVDEADSDAWIIDRTFRDAIVLGPAVLLPAGGVTMERVGMSGTPDSMFIELPPGKPAQGVVGLRNVSFIDCLFQDIAIIGTAETLNLYRAGLLRPGAPDVPVVAPAQLAQS